MAKTCDRFGISDRSAALVVSATLQDLGLIQNEDKTRVVDRSKIRRERLKVRRQLQCTPLGRFSGLYFDGRKDRTRTKIKKD